MRKLITLLIVSAFSSISFAGQIRYCDDMSRVPNMPHLNSDQFARYLRDKGDVDRILVSKYRRELYLIDDGVVLKTYHVAFGGDPLGGPKHFEGDQKTPEGLYNIDYKNPKSAYFLSLHTSYPNDADVDYARARGKSPGGDIMIHGFAIEPKMHAKAVANHPNDWTDGCMAVTDEEIKEIFALVKEKTAVEICSPQQR
ncbi:MAG TPA: L,D-transpeptidase family protein [Bdellovibrio sp.]|uniref:L,D-transpeptidase family protein n=1 Tax=Bdellovibrio sp. TaxID=28201 RepID=UPI002F22AAA5